MVIKNYVHQGIRLYISLILFFILFGCTAPENKKYESVIHWRNNRAVAIAIHEKNILAAAQEIITFHIAGKDDQPAILGNYTRVGDSILFEPLIPFTRGMTYEIRLHGKPITQIVIPGDDHNEKPRVTAIYPSQDTIPMNTLKMFIKFSKPMQEGVSLDHIVLLKNKRDTMRQVFLELKPELWNADRTLLTLWFDPGRIKRDLQPNRKLGTPLDAGNYYALSINSSWKDVDGTSLENEVMKTFVATSRDSVSPKLETWKINTVQAGTKQPLIISFLESLDYALLCEAIHVLNGQRKEVTGSVSPGTEEASFIFTPDQPWSRGNYFVECENRLEDLAGNNLDRPFDRDVTFEAGNASQKFHVRKFGIR